MKFKCKHCGEEFDNPQIFFIHEENCLDNQIQNGLLKEIDNGVNDDIKKSSKK